MPWIRQAQEKIALRRQHTTPPNTVSIFGKKYQQEIVFSRNTVGYLGRSFDCGSGGWDDGGRLGA